jgi:hypothetical protein
MDEIIINEFEKVLKLNQNICYKNIFKMDNGFVIKNTNVEINNRISTNEFDIIEKKLKPYMDLIDLELISSNILIIPK